jgi:cation diffusion facilitator CzcD-associated flavoprotein CzcO
VTIAVSADRDHRVVIVGAGPSGLSTAVALKDRGTRALVLDRADAVASAWRGRYDALRLNTWRRFSQPPGRPFPPGTPTFPTRDQVVAHLEGLAAEDGVELRLGTRVDRIDRANGGWRLLTPGASIDALQVVVATGYENEPAIPEWPGREGFRPPLMHSAAYRNATPFRGRRVLVVGPGCSGMEIAHDLAAGGAAEVLLSVRTAPNVLLRQGPGPVPGDVIAVALWHAPVRVGDAIARFGRRMDVGDLTAYGLPEPQEGVFSRSRRLGVAPAIVDPQVVADIKARRIEVVPAVEALDGDAVVLAGGRRVMPDAVVCATGYRRGLEPLVGHLGVLGERGLPRALGATPAAPGLRFVGYVPRPGGLGYMGKEARRAARAIERELAQASNATAGR